MSYHFICPDIQGEHFGFFGHFMAVPFKYPYPTCDMCLGMSYSMDLPSDICATWDDECYLKL